MGWRSIVRNRRTWLIGIPVAVVLLVGVGPFVYFNLIQDDPPPRLAFDDAEDADSDQGAGSSSTTSAAPAGGGQAAGGDVEGRWVIGAGSLAGYRIDEQLFAAATTAVGRTEDVTGELTIEGTTVATATFTVDMTTVESDESRRDGQFHGRIMDTATYPTAEFSLTEPIELGDLPADGEEVTVQATGELTVRGVTREVSFDLLARRNGADLEVNGSIPFELDDFDIPDASFGPAVVEDHGEIEVLLVLTAA
ncbi:MAG: YceI family protein [Acidimicrobiia bacterium]